VPGLVGGAERPGDRWRYLWLVTLSFKH